MRFYSKFSTHKIVLRRSFPGNYQLGVPDKPGITLSFRNGIADIEDEKVIEEARKSKAYGAEFFEEGTPQAEVLKGKKYATSEPVHRTIELTPAAGPDRDEVAKIAMDTIKSSISSILPELKQALLSSILPELKQAVTPVAPPEKSAVVTENEVVGDKAEHKAPKTTKKAT